MNFGDIQGPLNKLIKELKDIAKDVRCIKCADSSEVVTTSGIVTVPAGLKSFSGVKTSAGGTVVITLSDTTVYTLTEKGEVFVDAASPGSLLPEYTVALDGGATWKWHGIK